MKTLTMKTKFSNFPARTLVLTTVGILLALAMSLRICPQAVCRVHGGGFARTVQAYVPVTEFDNYRESMERIFGAGSVMPIQIGRPGVCALIDGKIILPKLSRP